jgi:hypothetical protein
MNTPRYTLTPNTDCEETLDVIVQDKCIGSIWFCEGRWDACNEEGKPLARLGAPSLVLGRQGPRTSGPDLGDASLFTATLTGIDAWEEEQ